MNKMNKIIVTGGTGLVGKALEKITKNDKKNEWIFLSSKNCNLLDYKQTLKFVNDVAKISEKLDHHGDIFFNYDTVKIEIYSHSHNAVTSKDIEFADAVSKK